MKQPATTLPRSQQGVAVILLFTVLFMAGASLFIAFANNNVLSLQSDRQSGQALREAKDALIAYAMMHGDYFGSAGAGPGHLPCPDTNNDGVEDAPCGNNPIGRLPQSVTVPLPVPGSTIQLSDFGDGIDEALWYGLTNAARRSPATAFNTSTVAGHLLDGQAVAAVLIAPGEALASQSRPSNNRTEYLEGSNTAGTSFVSTDGTGPENFNDRVLGITVEEIMIPVTARVVEAIRIELDNFHTLNGRYPIDALEYAAALLTVPAWFLTNNWHLVSQYTPATVDTADITFTGCPNITYTVNNITGTITRTGTRCL